MHEAAVSLTPPLTVADGYNLTDLERAGQLGSPVLTTDMDMLQVKPLRPFAAGEICAFKEALTPAQAAAAAAHRRAGTTDGEHRGTIPNPNFAFCFCFCNSGAKPSLTVQSNILTFAPRPHMLQALTHAKPVHVHTEGPTRGREIPQTLTPRRWTQSCGL